MQSNKKIKLTSSVECRGLKIPLYNRIINLGLFSFNKTSLLIDRLNPLTREWDKVNILINDVNYLTFLKRLTNSDKKEIVECLNDFNGDLKFKKSFSKKLELLDNSNIPWGDIRFHSLTVYVAVRLLKPSIMVETGVASGKSTTMILLALEHNRRGRLVSIDLPNRTGMTLADGGKTHTDRLQVGWLVPNYLKKHWQLNLGDSKILLPEIIKKFAGIDIFLHDSLHTYKHVKFELETVWPKLKKKSLILCDNIDLGAGKAFDEFLSQQCLTGYAYRDFGGVRIIKKGVNCKKLGVDQEIN